MLVGGIDVGGKRCRIVFVDPRRPEKPTIWGFEPDDMKQISHVEAARRAHVWARLHFQMITPPSVIYVEQPFGAQARSNFQLSVMAGAVVAAIPVETSVEFISPGEARRLVGLGARAEKKTIMAWALEQTGLELDEHSSDALVCARAVLAFGVKGAVA
jgi:hypothetical protein